MVATPAGRYLAVRPRPPAALSEQWQRLPEPVRAVVRDEATAVGRELRSIRRPRDLRRLLRDPDALTRVSEPLAPGLDRILAVVARGAVPLPASAAGIAVAAAGIAGATVTSALEVGGLLGIEVPPAAAAAAGAAGTVAVAAELVEFYLIASLAWTRLRAAGRADPATLRRVLLEAYLGPERARTGPLGGRATGGADLLARALVRRILPRLAPVAGIPVAGWSAWRDLKRAESAVERILASPPEPSG